MDDHLTPLERTCKMIGEKYGPQMRELLAQIKERKERDRLLQLSQTTNKTLAKPAE